MSSFLEVTFASSGSAMFSQKDHGDVEYVYTVNVLKRDGNGFPMVSYRKVLS